MTVQEMIDGSLRLIGAIATGETPTSAERDDALVRVNTIIDSWNAEPNAIAESTVTDISVVGAPSTTLTPRPLLVLGASATFGGAVTQPVEVCSAQRWAEIAIDRAGTATFPKGVFCDYGSPATLHIGPRFTGILQVITAVPAFVAFSALSDTITLEAGYLKALQYALAVELAPEFGRSGVLPVIGPLAQEAKASLGNLNQLRRAFAQPEVSK